ncbi:MAG: Uma2 family endonuclease [Planctomycetia bacterium]|nr:Uma2 family endonuclease [Planctomycetia bacterium]
MKTKPPPEIFYPDSDGQPMADNTLQFDWIAILKWNIEACFRARPDVFVAGDHLIYPVEGDPETRQAPDVYVAFGAEKKYRGSYRVWEEKGIFPQVVFEVWSPNNRFEQMQKKLAFYERFGAEEYYIVYPDHPSHLEIWIRREGKFESIAEPNGFVSPRLGLRFLLERGSLTVYGPDGRQLKRPDEIAEQLEETEEWLARERVRAEQERQRAETEKQRAEAERQRAEAEKQRADFLAARLRQLGVDPDAP